MNSLPKSQSRPLFAKSEKPRPCAQVVFNLPLKNAFTYEIPSRFDGMVQAGMRVFVPFGKRRITGYVVSVSKKLETKFPLKPIEDIPDEGPVLSEELLSLTRWVADYYHASWGEAIKAALPAGLDDESREVLSVTDKGRAAMKQGGLTENAVLILRSVSEKRRASSKQLQRLLKKRFSAHTLSRLKQDGLLAEETHIKRSTVGHIYEKAVRLASSNHESPDIEKLLSRSPKQKAIYRLILQKEMTLAELKREVSSYSGPLRQLREKKLVETFTVKNHRDSQSSGPGPSWTPEAPLKFNPEQKKCFGELCVSIDASEFNTFLLRGVTGSGKTEIYLRCIQRALEQGKTAIMVVPEISLTPQTVSRFQRRLGGQVAVLHSGLSQVERYREWKNIREGKVSVVVGARSAIFAPFKNIGVIVIDEEHDTSYKQDSTPRYHARDTAIVRARSENAVVVLGSATPSLESLKNASDGKYRFLSLNKRVYDRMLPVVRIVDMAKEKDEKKNFSIFSSDLKKAVRDRLERKEQVFLFLNRRGTANYVFCRECKFVFQCDHCSVTMTFHGNEHSLRCHYCGFTSRPPKTCPDCGGDVIRFSGFGTQKLETETKRLFPNARILRLDRDTTKKSGAFDSMHRKMCGGEIDILIGTQMISKGHDFPNVTLVGVVYADISLHIPDFRSCERSFQLLTQVAGRAGRGTVPGQVIVQTLNPEHYVFDSVQDHDYEKFSEKEMRIRKKLNYPPYTRMAALEIESGNEKQAESHARKIKRALVGIITRSRGIEILGPSPSVLYRINNRFRWHIVIRASRIQSLQSLLRECETLQALRPASTGKVKVTIDVDPVDLL